MKEKEAPKLIESEAIECLAAMDAGKKFDPSEYELPEEEFYGINESNVGGVLMHLFLIFVVTIAGVIYLKFRSC